MVADGLIAAQASKQAAVDTETHFVRSAPLLRRRVRGRLLLLQRRRRRHWCWCRCCRRCVPILLVVLALFSLLHHPIVLVSGADRCPCCCWCCFGGGCWCGRRLVHGSGRCLPTQPLDRSIDPLLYVRARDWLVTLCACVAACRLQSPAMTHVLDTDLIRVLPAHLPNKGARSTPQSSILKIQTGRVSINHAAGLPAPIKQAKRRTFHPDRVSSHHMASPEPPPGGELAANGNTSSSTATVVGVRMTFGVSRPSTVDGGARAPREQTHAFECMTLLEALPPRVRTWAAALRCIGAERAFDIDAVASTEILAFASINGPPTHPRPPPPYAHGPHTPQAPPPTRAGTTADCCRRCRRGDRTVPHLKLSWCVRGGD